MAKSKTASTRVSGLDPECLCLDKTALTPVTDEAGWRPGRGSNDPRPLSLNTGQISIYDIPNEEPSLTANPPSADFRKPKSKSSTPKKGGVAKKIFFGSIRKIFSPKQKSTGPKLYALEFQQAFIERYGLGYFQVAATN
ncbi:MAG: hypothetical protein L6R38_001823 [Xanthoria sp. 2 TBL-2021]|nr:MAG: hypothetical protein L6R38_001823 [Xanthoria sp. 2 TBL-2021]